MIKAYDTIDLYTGIRHPDFHIEHQNYADIKDYFTIYTISFKHPRKRCVEVAIRFSERSNIEELSNYIEVISGDDAIENDVIKPGDTFEIDGKVYNSEYIKKHWSELNILMQQQKDMECLDILEGDND